jgi:hypothetical protein
MWGVRKRCAAASSSLVGDVEGAIAFW